MTTHDFDNLLKSIRDDVPSDDALQASAARVRTRLGSELAQTVEVSRLESCADFRALLPAFRNRTLSEARQMLVEDHLHSCVACRKVFHAERPAVIPIRAARPVWNVLPWAIAAAAVVAVYFTIPPVLDRVLAPSGERATVASVHGELYRVSASGATLLNAGAVIGENEQVRTARNSRAMIRLRDGSTVEMAERSDLTVTERWRGKTVHLTRGSVMVEAAKQRRGRLEIQTPDALVSVKGTIFEVSSGIKGSRVSVVEGEVKVDQDGATALLHRGDQKTTSQSMETTSVAEDVGWSQNSAKYLALLGELSAIQKRIEQIPGPGLRYQSKLAGLLPENTMVFASIPNLGPTLAEATSIFEDRVKQSEVLREWWNAKETQQLKAMVDQVRTFSDYLGDEIVLAVPAGPNPSPLLIAEARRPELRQYLEKQFAQIQGADAPKLLDEPLTSIASSHGPLVMVHGNVVAVAMRPDYLTRVASLADAGANGGFLSILRKTNRAVLSIGRGLAPGGKHGTNRGRRRISVERDEIRRRRQREISDHRTQTKLRPHRKQRDIELRGRPARHGELAVRSGTHGDARFRLSRSHLRVFLSHQESGHAAQRIDRSGRLESVPRRIPAADRCESAHRHRAEPGWRDDRRHRRPAAAHAELESRH